MTSIRKSISSGIFFTAATRYSGVLISISIGAVLARLITPSEFGLVALVTVFVTFFNLLSDFGIGPAVVQNQSLSNRDIQSIFLLSILVGIFLSASFFFASHIIAIFYNEPELIPISRLLALSVLFYSLQTVPKALYLKSLKFKQIGIITISIQFFSSVIAIILAFKGFSYYALVVQSILVAGISMVTFYIVAPIKFKLTLRKESVHKIFRFSSFQFMFNFINYFSRNLDNILIGKYFIPSALGYYDKSYLLMSMPVNNLTRVITPVLMPVLSKHHQDKELVFNVYLKVIKILATIGFPLSVYLFFTASEIINIVFGPQWGESIPVFKVLALSVGLQMILSSTGSIFQAVNRTDLMFYGGLLTAIFMVLGICYGVFIEKNLVSVGYGLLIAFSINFFIWLYLLISSALKQSFLQFLKKFFFPFLISCGIGIVLFIESNFHYSSFLLSFFVKSFLTGLTFTLIFIIKSENRNLLKNYLMIFLRKRHEHTNDT
jgi:PST family polysaccharide transporter